ncbi:MAG: MmgE/PrpD family protein [Desulfuromonadales bacterium]
MFTSELIARDLLSVTRADLGPSTIGNARRCLLDLFGAAASGFHAPPAEALRRLAGRRAGESRLWFSPYTACPESAAMANSAAASALDLDDGHRWAGGHPGAAVIPAALAAGETEGRSLGEVLTAITVGYEAAVRIAAARDFPKLYALSTGRWSAYGVVAAAAWLRDVKPEQLAQALVIAGELSPWLVGSGFSQFMGNHVKEGIPWSTHLGLMALDMACAGITGPLDLFDNLEHYDHDRITREFGAAWRIDGVYFKPYACCRWIHTALDALSSLMHLTPLTAAEIDRIEVHTVRRALTLNNHPQPASLESAQYSFPFCLALLACDGPRSLLLMRHELLGRRDVTALAVKVQLVVDPELDNRFPAQCPARVVVHARGEIYSMQVDVPLGDPGRPLSNLALARKFLLLTRHSLAGAVAKKICRGFLTLDEAMPVAKLLDSVPFFEVSDGLKQLNVHGGDHD